MATLVRQRKYKKRKKNKLTKKIQRTKLVYPKLNVSIKWLWVFILIVIFVYWLFFIINNTILKPENYIENITYSKASVENYDDPYLYKKISELIKYENYFVVSKFRKSNIVEQIKSEFPLVKDIEIIQPQKFTASVKVEFYDPEIIVRLWNRKFGVLWKYNFEIFSWNKIWNWVFSVEIPQYTSWIDSLHWIFFEIPQPKFIYDMEMIAQWFPWYKRLVYLPWSSMTVVFVWENKRVYLNNKNSLTWQITNYNLLQKYYDEANKLRIIDLGSLEWDKIIVRQ